MPDQPVGDTAAQPRVDRHVAIPMRDGVRLSAALHWPPGAPERNPSTALGASGAASPLPPGDGRPSAVGAGEGHRVGGAQWHGPKYPVVIEYHPYRKDDRSAPRASDHDYFARHGYVSVRLDVRGSGSSEGVNTDEYMPIETQDGYDAIEWLAAQPWCNGKAGMFGSSYGGFTCFQVATLQPPHLAAIAPMYVTDDRYTDDCHYKGGAFKAYYDTGTYATMMIALNALPPDPEACPDPEAMEQAWRERFERNEPYMLHWLTHQTDGPYWRPGSLRGQYGKVQAATFIIGGWQDGYPNPPGRAYAALSCPKKLLIGPWNHSRPDVAVPGPRVHYLREIRRWFDLWLKGEDDGISKEPPVTFYVQSYDRPDPARKDTTGEWRSEREWPPRGVRARRLHLKNGAAAQTGSLATRPAGGGTTASLEVDPAAGLQGGLWSGGLPFGLPGDQRADEALSLAYTSSPLSGPLTVCGHAVVRLRASSSAPVAVFVVKLADVAQDGTSALVTRGVLNGTRRNGMSHPEPMTPGEQYDLKIELDATAWRFEAGHRMRLAISGSDFPNSWPTPLPATITVRDAHSLLELPLLGGDGLPPAQFEAPPARPATGATQEPHVWQVTNDVLAQTVTLTLHRGGRSATPTGGWSQSSDDLTLSLNRRDPADVRAVGTHRAILDDPRAGTIEAVARQEIQSDAAAFHWRVDLDVTRDGNPWGKRSWQRSFPRQML